MHLSATIVNALWSASNLHAYWRFLGALRNPRAAQEKILRAHLDLNANTAFGRAYDCRAIQSYEEFARCVPLGNYDSFQPWITRVGGGEANVLSRDPVTHLVPTGGSAGARKLIPFTAGLQDQFNAAIAPWLVDLQRQYPALAAGPAYWSISPVYSGASMEKSALPIGFDSDTEYLGGIRGRLADAVMAVPKEVLGAPSIKSFQYETLFHLLRCRELRLISIWHPSFFTLLLDALPNLWELILSEIENGRGRFIKPLKARAEELRESGPFDPLRLWPKLRVISCWGDGNAELAISGLKRRLPGILFQRKGLLATEGVVTIPFSGLYPLAVRSHFFEFINEQNHVRLAHELRVGELYEPVLTTAGGLWRYRLGDRVRVTGFLEKTPSLKFLGRTHGVSDHFGEKLHETFVASAIQEILGDSIKLLRFILLAPDEAEDGCCYTLYVEGELPFPVLFRLDEILQRNPQYAWCRELGQLRFPKLFQIQTGGMETFVSRQSGLGQRLGELKPCFLSPLSGWTHCFHGVYQSPTPPDLIKSNFPFPQHCE